MNYGFPDKQEMKGVTLVELLAALTASALVVILAGRLFLTGHREYLARVFESDRLSDLVRLKGALHQGLRGEVTTCRGGALRMRTDSTDLDLAAWVRGRYPGADSISFTCFEVGSGREDLVEWKERFQPQLIAYGVRLKNGKAADWLRESVLR